jgi:hypothetical protein
LALPWGHAQVAVKSLPLLVEVMVAVVTVLVAAWAADNVPRLMAGRSRTEIVEVSANQRGIVESGARADQGRSQPAGALVTIVDETFSDNRRGWPNEPQATTWLEGGGYRLSAREPGRFVAVTAPGLAPVRNGVVSATFRKIGGPPVGGYGIIVRDQGPSPRDGLNQGGRYYAFEVGNRGEGAEAGVWLREEDRWVDVLPWTRTTAVQTGEAANELTVAALGQQLSFLVNGVTVWTLTDPVLSDGTVGIIVSGDLNDVRLERFVVQLPQ